MHIDYEKIFEARGNLYDRTMIRMPRARENEFAMLFTQHSPAAKAVLIDVPSGGGYLKQFLPSDIVYHPLFHDRS